MKLAFLTSILTVCAALLISIAAHATQSQSEACISASALQCSTPLEASAQSCAESVSSHNPNPTLQPPESASQTTQVKDFSFVDRDGEARSIAETLAAYPIDYLLLFDPDCDECHALIGQLREWDAKVIAIFPVDEPLTADDPNLVAYQRACSELPVDWIVGIDNGAILEGDLYSWEHLPMLIPINHSSTTIPSDNE